MDSSAIVAGIIGHNVPYVPYDVYHNESHFWIYPEVVAGLSILSPLLWMIPSKTILPHALAVLASFSILILWILVYALHSRVFWSLCYRDYPVCLPYDEWMVMKAFSGLSIVSWLVSVFLVCKSV